MSNDPVRRHQTLVKPNGPMTLSTFYDAAADRVLGNSYWWEARIMDTGTAGGLLASVTVQRSSTDAAAGYTINGGTAAVVFTSASRMLWLYGWFDFPTKNWVVKSVLP